MTKNGSKWPMDPGPNTIRWNKDPVCENCGAAPARWFGANPRDGSWRLLCLGCEDPYEVAIGDFFASPASVVDWLAHLNEKPWFSARGFAEMMDRFREATGSYFCLSRSQSSGGAGNSES